MTNPIVWFEIYAQDLERAKKFYETVLATELRKLESPNPEMELWTFPMEDNKYGATGALVKMKGFAPEGGGTIVYFSCHDCAEEEARVEKAGGRIERSKTAIGEYGFISLVVDTEGNMIGLHSMQ